MKIALVTREFFPLTGGLQVLAAQLGRELKKHGHDFLVITRFTRTRLDLRNHLVRSQLDETLEVGGVKVQVVGHSRSFGVVVDVLYKTLFKEGMEGFLIQPFAQTYQNKIGKAVETFDVVHFLGQGLELLGFAAASSARNLGKPFVVEPCVHPGQWGDHPVDLKLYRQADALIAHSHFERRFLESKGIDPRKITVLHGFEDRTDGDGARFRKKHNIPNFMVLFLGRRSKDKGYPVVVQAFVDFLKRHQADAVLVVAGPTDEERIQAPAPYAERILELGKLDEDEKHDALAACDVLCVPSEGESFGIVYMEAWRYKKPIIARRIPVLEEINGDSPGGVLVENSPAVAANVSEALSLLFQNERLRRDLGERGFHIASRFVWENVVAGYLEVYQQARAWKDERP
ncbi:MAG: glycosyltransferase family 4 protein [Chloracidobacterium sp.]|nr:glycosyltransferase family 4 protein [Chloracidobacterium sp.]MDW8217987.1 glycosyltransferase family 4 protein [Acidobacteriota bacterium]